MRAAPTLRTVDDRRFSTLCWGSPTTVQRGEGARSAGGLRAQAHTALRRPRECPPTLFPRNGGGQTGGAGQERAHRYPPPPGTPIFRPTDRSRFTRTSAKRTHHHAVGEGVRSAGSLRAQAHTILCRPCECSPTLFPRNGGGQTARSGQERACTAPAARAILDLPPHRSLPIHANVDEANRSVYQGPYTIHVDAKEHSRTGKGRLYPVPCTLSPICSPPSPRWRKGAPLNAGPLPG
jgi:hypothetical protein